VGHPSATDAIVIGSGMGGLTTAALLARLHGRRVVVLERHWRAGGFTHTFSRPGGFTWDVGVHYVGAEAVGSGMAGDALRVATGGQVSWTRMPDPFERLVFPDFEFEIRSGAERFEADLVRAFPDEARAVRGFLRDVRRAASITTLLGLRAVAPRPVAAAARALLSARVRLARRTTREVLDARFRDARLKAVLGARWGDHGMPPGQGAFLIHAVITAHYLEGAFYPEGSAARIAEGAASVIEEAGGEVRVRAEVERILVENGCAVGVRLRGGEELRAPVVVSDAGARATYLRLLPPELPIAFRDRLRGAAPSMAHVSLYLGLRSSAASLGVQGENFWIHDALDQDGLWSRRSEVLEGRPSHVYLSFPSMKDPAARAHTAEIVTAVDAAAFSRFSGTPWRRRGAEYEELKARIAEGLLATAERRLPGLTNLVAYRELSTPLSTETFTGHPGGEIYGIPWTPERLDMDFLGARTPVPGLFLTGADAMMLGVTGALMGGLVAAAAVAGPSTFRLVRSAAARLSTEPTRTVARPSTAGTPA